MQATTPFLDSQAVHIGNRWHLANEERGQLIAACNLRQPLGSDWNCLIASDQL